MSFVYLCLVLVVSGVLQCSAVTDDPGKGGGKACFVFSPTDKSPDIPLSWNGSHWMASYERPVYDGWGVYAHFKGELYSVKSEVVVPWFQGLGFTVLAALLSGYLARRLEDS